MRVFVTGATGFVGTAVVRELMSAGHQVTGLAKTESNVRDLTAAGARVHRGALEDLESLRRGAIESDGVIHCGFVRDFARFKEACEIDERAIAAMGEALAGSNRPLVVSSVLGFLSPGRLATEDTLRPANAKMPRVSEETVMAFANKGVRATAVRLAPATHGKGDHGFIATLIELARAKAAAAFVDEGQNVWPGVHRLDAARLFRLALEKGEAGKRYHATDEQGVPLRQIAETIARTLDVPVERKTGEEAARYFGGFAPFAGMDCPASSQATRESLGWEPREIGLLADIEANYL